MASASSWTNPVKGLALSALRKNLTSSCWSKSGSSFAITPLKIPERQVSKPTCMGEPGFALDHRFGSAGVGRHVCDCEESVRSEIWDELGAISGAGAGSRDGSGGSAGLGGRLQTFQAPSSPPSAHAQAVRGEGGRLRNLLSGSKALRDVRVYARGRSIRGDQHHLRWNVDLLS